MVKKVGTYPIPFDEHGNQLSYPCQWQKPQWFPNDKFEDTLIYRGAGRGRSAVTFEFERQSTGKTVTVFLTDFSDFIPHMVNGVVKGTFQHVKRGQNYGTAKLETK